MILIKLGEKPRGIIGHGNVIREIYDRNHYDSEKAAKGKKEKAIDVEYDRLINYEKKIYRPSRISDRMRSSTLESTEFWH